MRITEQYLNERKDRLLHVAYELFCEYGIDAVPLSTISKQSNVSLNAIYHYYDSKATLVKHTQKILWEEMSAQILTDGQEQLACTKNGWEEISVLLLNFKRLYRHHKRYLLFSCDYKAFLVRNDLKLSKESYHEMFAPVYKIFIEALKRGQADGSISRSHNIQDQFFAIWGVARGYVEQMAVYDQIYDGTNPWLERFDLVLQATLENLRNKES